MNTKLHSKSYCYLQLWQPWESSEMSLISDIQDWRKISRHPEFFVDRTPSEYNLMLLPVVVKSSLSNAIRRGGEGKAACDSIWGGRLESLWWPTISIKDYLTNHIWRILIVMCRITLLSLPLIPLDHRQDPPSTVNVACMYLQVNRITITSWNISFSEGRGK